MATSKEVRKTGTQTGAKEAGSKTAGKAKAVPEHKTPPTRAENADTSKRRATSKGTKVTATKESKAAIPGGARMAAGDSKIAFRDGSKGGAIVNLLKLKSGATIADLIKATGWQAHSVRGFLSGALKKKAGLSIASEKGDDGERRYRLAS